MPSNPYYKFISYLFKRVGDTFTINEIKQKWERFAKKNPNLVPPPVHVLTETLMIRSFLDGKIEKGEVQKLDGDKYRKAKINQKNSEKKENN